MSKKNLNLFHYSLEYIALINKLSTQELLEKFYKIVRHCKQNNKHNKHLKIENWIKNKKLNLINKKI